MRLLSLISLLLAPGALLAGSVELPTQVGGAYSIKVKSIREAKFAATVHQQFDFSCGSAAISTLLTHHYGVAIGEQRVFEDMYLHGDDMKIRREGFSLLDMKRYLASLGFEADGFEAPLESLAEAEVPAVALINEKGYNHFVVIKGLRNGRVLIGDPAAGTRSIAVDRFEASRVNQILFVISNQRDRALFNLAADWNLRPNAPIAAGIAAGTTTLALPKLSPTDF